MSQLSASGGIFGGAESLLLHGGFLLLQQAGSAL